MQKKLEKALDTAWYTPMHIFVKVETQSSSDIDCKKSAHPDQLGFELVWGFVLFQSRTTDAPYGNSLHCTAENSLPLPNF
jgi:hypothetical protein